MSGRNWGAAPPQPPRKSASTRVAKVLWIIVGGFALFMVVGIALFGRGDNPRPADAGGSGPATSTTTQQPAESAAPTHDPAKTLGKNVATSSCGQAAEAKLKRAFPGSTVKVHSITGIVDQTYVGAPEESAWRITLDATVDGKAERVQCLVKGTDLKPEVKAVGSDAFGRAPVPVEAGP